MDCSGVCTPLLLRLEQHSLQPEKSNNGDFDFQPDCLETQSSALMPSIGANSQQTLRNDSHFQLSSEAGVYLWWRRVRWMTRLPVNYTHLTLSYKIVRLQALKELFFSSEASPFINMLSRPMGALKGIAQPKWKILFIYKPSWHPSILFFLEPNTFSWYCGSWGFS